MLLMLLSAACAGLQWCARPRRIGNNSVLPVRLEVPYSAGICITGLNPQLPS